MEVMAGYSAASEMRGDIQHGSAAAICVPRRPVRRPAPRHEYWKAAAGGGARQAETQPATSAEKYAAAARRVWRNQVKGGSARCSVLRATAGVPRKLGGEFWRRRATV